uniref:Small ribosomal subunit protein uS13c n=1 Tax=Rhizochromulina marina TaxID=1034831 RepID=A0A514CPU0_9STRA|nr:ribosomal protein S13 [Rhizochromulina marina]QDH81823.1 ribosomal protein S13 [Rhizochromulina marina]
MVRIAGIDLPRTKRIDYALTSIFGIGQNSAQIIVEKAKIDPTIRVNELTDDDVSKIREIIETEFSVEGDLKRTTNLTIKRLSEINCYRGRRHRQQLPVRGQRTRTNARSRRGSKKTVAGKKK